MRALHRLPDMKREIAQQENALSILAGAYPGPIPRGMTLTAQQMPPQTPVGLSTDLLRRRPDIRAAEQGMISANAADRGGDCQLLSADRPISACRPYWDRGSWRPRWKFRFLEGRAQHRGPDLHRRAASIRISQPQGLLGRDSCPVPANDPGRVPGNIRRARRPAEARRRTGGAGNQGRREPAVDRSGTSTLPRGPRELFRGDRGPAAAVSGGRSAGESAAGAARRSGQSLQGAWGVAGTLPMPSSSDTADRESRKGART